MSTTSDLPMQYTAGVLRIYREHDLCMRWRFTQSETRRPCPRGFAISVDRRETAEGGAVSGGGDESVAVSVAHV